MEIKSGELNQDENTTTTNEGKFEIGAAATFAETSSKDQFVNNGSLEPDIGGPTSFGTVTVSGGAAFHPGAALFPALVGGYEPPVGTEFDVIASTAAISGEFLKVENDFEGDYSKADIIAVRRIAALAKPEVTKDPEAKTVTAGEPVSFTAEASGNPAPTVQWEVSEGGGAFKDVPSAIADTYTISATNVSESGNHYKAVFTNSQGKATSKEVTLTVNPPPCAADPGIEEQPKAQTVTAPATASFKARGSTPANCAAPSVQWYSKAPGALSFSPILGAESASYTTPPTATTETGTKFEATFTNAFGSTTTEEVTLTVNPPPCAADPGIEEQPKAQTVTAPATASFKARGSTPANCAAPSVQWYSKAPGALSFSPILGAESASYTTPPTATTETGTKFEATFTNAFGSTTTEEVTLTVNPPPCAADPGIEEQPKAQTVTAPATASFKARGSTPANCAAPSVQWYSKAPGALSFSPILGAESASYTTPPTATTETGTKFEATFTNAFGSTTTEEVTLTVNPPPCAADPGIEEQPKAQTVTAPATASFKARGSTPANCAAPSVQWYSKAPGALSFSPILGAESASYTTPPTATTETGTKFEATFTNAFGSTTTEEVTLTVNPPPCAADPGIEEQPKAQTVTAPATASFKARGSTPANCAAPSVQWYSKAPGALSFSPILGAESASYTTPPTATTETGTKFEATFTNAFGSTTTEEVTLTVNPALAKPEVTVPPKDDTVTAPAAASFTAEASGNPAPTVQWEISEAGGAFKEVSGATADTYTIPTTKASESGDRYEAVFTNSQGKATSAIATLTVNPALAKPEVTVPPKDDTVTAPAAASFTAEASGNPAPTVQWEISEAGGAFKEVSGATADTYTIPTTKASESGDRYEAVFTNSQGKATSAIATLTVNPALAKPEVTVPPKDDTVTAPAAASFTAEASGNPAPTVQWEISEAGGAFKEVSGATADTYTIPTTKASESGDRYEAVFTNSQGKATSAIATLTVNPALAKPEVTVPPKDDTVTAPAAASFTAEASGNPAPTVQWEISEAGGAFKEVSGATADTYTIPTTKASESGDRYEAVFTNSQGKATSAIATLTVNPALAKPEVTVPPKDDTVTAPAAASFTAEASGNPAPTVQWEISEAGGAFKEVSGATADTYTIPTTKASESGDRYEAVFTNSQGKATSAIATLTVNPALAKPEVTVPPKDDTVTAPAAASFTAEASGNPAPTVQWEISEAGGAFKEVSGATADTYTIPTTKASESGDRYEAVFTNSQGKATSAIATLTVNPALAKPEVTVPPKDDTVTAPAAASFTAEASGNPAPTVQWEISEAGGAFKEVSGATADTYTIPTTKASESGDRYEAVFTNSQGKATSAIATLTVNPALAKPEVTVPPKDDTVTAPAAASFTAEASGNPAPTVQWEISEAGGAFKEVSGATADTYTIPTTKASESGDRYEAVFTNSQGKATSAIATLTVNPALAKPEVTVPPKDDTVTAPAAASFTAEASGNPAPTVQWEISEAGGAFKEVSGATADTYTIPTTKASESGDRYEAVFTNSQGKATSAIATLTVNPALAKPEVTVPPKDDTVTAPAAASFTAEASGNPAPTVQWEISEAGGAFKEVSGATADTYTIPTTKASESGDRYEAVFTNSQGKATSAIATLTVNPPPCAAAPKSQNNRKPRPSPLRPRRASKRPARRPPTARPRRCSGPQRLPEPAPSRRSPGPPHPPTRRPPRARPRPAPSSGPSSPTRSQGTTTDEVTLTVNPPLTEPNVSKQPEAKTVTAGEPVTFSAEASGNPSPTVQWELSEGGGPFVEMPGATADTYTILVTNVSESGYRYRAVFTNSQGKATSKEVTLTVDPVPPTVSSIAPESGSTLGGTPVTIKGTGFLTGAKVTIGSAAGSITVVSETEIKATTSATGPGPDEVIVTDANGTSTGGPTFGYVTPAPAAEGIAASSVTQTLATLHATVNPEGAEVTKCQFEYGPTTAYGIVAPCSPLPGSGSTPVEVSAPLSGLSANTTYHFRIFATNAGGETRSVDETFKTLAIPPPTVTSINPTEGPAAGGTSVTIKGSGFVAPASVTIGTVVEVVSETEIKATTAAGTGSREVEVTDANGNSTGGPFYTYITPPCAAAPEITEQPKAETVTAPATASFKAAGSTPANCTAPTVQWSSEAPGAGSFSPISGATSPTYTTPASSTTQSGTKFRAVFTNAFSGTTTDEVTMTVNPPPCAAASEITEQPKAETVTAPATASFKAGASTPANCAAPTVQWSSEAPGASSFSPIAGATSPTYTTPATSTTETGTKFRAVFTNAFSGTTTDEVTMTVNPPPCAAAPEITEQPKAETVTAPATASFKAAGSTPANCTAPTVQWSSEAPGASSFSPIAGATSPTYTTPATSTTETGTKFRAVFTNAFSGATTDEVTLTVNAASAPETPPSTAGTGTVSTETAKSGVLASTTAAPPPPKLGVSGNVAPVSGTVLVRLPGTSIFVPLTTIRQIPFGTVINATNGKVTVTTRAPNGAIQTITYSQGEFKLTQGPDGFVVATLVGGSFAVCPTAARAQPHRASQLPRRPSQSMSCANCGPKVMASTRPRATTPPEPFSAPAG